MGGKGKSKTTSKGASKGASKTSVAPVKKFVTKQESSPKGKGKSKGGDGGGYWAWVPASSSPKGKGKSNSVGKGKSSAPPPSKGKGKGKGKKGKRAAPLGSKIWENKLEEENRKLLGTRSYTGVIQMYNWKQGWGLILPDDPSSLPKEITAALEKNAAEQEANGKEVKNPNNIYFRKPDVNHEEGFKVGADIAVTFQVYIDEKGAGACEVSQA
eukprot:gnl/TRDRNA2_/TRDRNA2_181949_c0_seq1.p1 gnl/TRDRNA2_/TRDRNA2_181949_c0~~gnl/TRDRNA2_/TRDRNA2_181949_c0_seq1.p1  ORF type:complete len:225 (-),score=61.79 gnl/TRDRNA2_/TRDRNA2_181949_c0_seq1:44-682(-)